MQPWSVVRKTLSRLSTRELGPGKSGDRDFWIRALLISGLISHLDLSLIFWVSSLNLVTEEPVYFGSWSCHVPRQIHINTEKPAPTRRAAPLLTHAPRTLVLIRVASPYLETRPPKPLRKNRITVNLLRDGRDAYHKAGLAHAWRYRA